MLYFRLGTNKKMFFKKLFFLVDCNCVPPLSGRATKKGNFFCCGFPNPNRIGVKGLIRIRFFLTVGYKSYYFNVDRPNYGSKIINKRTLVQIK